jgi:formylglycine-generating enzyme required for sulfatase activity
MKFVEILPGEFMMGSHESTAEIAKLAVKEFYKPDRVEDEFPQHKVRITKRFYLSQYEFTIGQFKQFVKETGYKTEAETDDGGWGYDPQTKQFEGRDLKYSWRNPGFKQGDDHPVVNITWKDANEVCKWLSKRENRTYRLPTEAEWEYACRAGTKTRYFFGDDPAKLVEYANVCDQSTVKMMPEWAPGAVKESDGFAFTAPVGSFKPNPWGLYDMHGNVWEWCSDWHAPDYYSKSPVDDPKGAESGDVRVRRGAAWHSWPIYMRSSFRNWNTPESRYPNLGLRPVLEP